MSAAPPDDWMDAPWDDDPDTSETTPVSELAERCYTALCDAIDDACTTHGMDALQLLEAAQYALLALIRTIYAQLTEEERDAP